jgi:hypothetical protein
MIVVQDVDQSVSLLTEHTLNPLNSIIAVFPNQGILNPFEKRPLFFRFSPRSVNECRHSTRERCRTTRLFVLVCCSSVYSPKQAFTSILDLPPKRDIATFMYFELLGASPGLANIEHSKTKLEIAIAGTALPVILSMEPHCLQYPLTYVGQKNDDMIHIYNQSDHQSIDFRFPSIANFAVQPASGKLKPREKLSVIVTFIPHQMGSCSLLFIVFVRSLFHIDQGAISKTLVCEVLGAVVHPDVPVYTQAQTIHRVQCQLAGQAAMISEMPAEKFNMGHLSSNDANRSCLYDPCISCLVQVSSR